MMLSPRRQLNSRRQSMDKENLKDLSANRRSNRRKSFDGTPRSAGLSPQLTPNSANSRRTSLGGGSALLMGKENSNGLSANRRSNRRKSLDGVSPRSAGLSPRTTPNNSNVLQVHINFLRTGTVQTSFPFLHMARQV